MVAYLGKFAKTFRRKLKILKFLISENFNLRWTIANLMFCDRESSYVNLKCQLQGFCNLRLTFLIFTICIVVFTSEISHLLLKETFE